MSKITGNEPVYPNYREENGLGGTDGGQLTKREYFAAMAMQGFCSAGYGDFNDHHTNYIAEMSVKQADALIAELNKETK